MPFEHNRIFLIQKTINYEHCVDNGGSARWPACSPDLTTHGFIFVMIHKRFGTCASVGLVFNALLTATNHELTTFIFSVKAGSSKICLNAVAS